MPTTWNRTPEDFHKIYVANTDAFYKAGGQQYSAELDEFMTNCALQLWKRAGGIGENHVMMANELYSRGRQKPSWMQWSLTEKVCKDTAFLPPVFFWALAENDEKKGTEISRTFIRMFTNILLYLAAVDDDVSYSEAEFITECTDKLNAICDSTGVKKGKNALNAFEFVTSNEPSFVAKHAEQSSGETGASANKETEEEPAKSFDELMEELESMVGLEEVKKDVKNMMNLVKVRRLRQENGLPVTDLSLHMVFTGNPGTGKSTVARLVSGLYASIGVLSKGQLVEVDRSGLVAGYVGQTALKTQEVIKSALGGVLFIDEAYSLASGGEQDFGREAIETILKAMEDNRENLVVIVAGYDELMEKFINSNPGLQSRFNRYFHFPDYNGDELYSMFMMRCRKNSYELEAKADEEVKKIFCEMYENRGSNFGNGRDVRNFFENMVVRQSNRVAAMENPTKEDLITVKEEDLKDAEQKD